VDVTVVAPDGQPYQARHQRLTWEGGVVRRGLDFTLPRGVLVRGRVAEAGSGRPVAGALVVYSQRRRDNPFYRPQDSVPTPRPKAGPDGSFSLAVPPGPGHLLVLGPTPDFVHVETTDGDLDEGAPGYHRSYPDALVALDLKPGAGPHEVKPTLRRGVTIRGRVVGPDGKPVARATLVCRSYQPTAYYYRQDFLPVRDGAFELPGCDPDKPSTVYVIDTEHNTGATAELSAGEAARGPVTVRLAPCGSVSFRVVDPSGKPFAGHGQFHGRVYLAVELVVTPGQSAFLYKESGTVADTVFVENFDSKRYYAIKADADGRLTLPFLIPGATHRVTARGPGGPDVREFRAESGKTHELPAFTLPRDE
jgi:hypothetical protein